MSNYFEFSAKADEWLDVTSKEEILQNELNRTKNDLETRSMEILESNVTIDLLKGHKTLLESERESLKDALKRTKETLSDTTKDLQDMTLRKENVEKDLEELKTSSELKIKKLQEALALNNEELATAKSQILEFEQLNIALKIEQQSEKAESKTTIETLTRLVEKLNHNVRSLEDDSKKQREQVAQSQKDLQQARSREQMLRGDLIKQTSLSEQRTKELKEFQSKIGSVSILAESLKDKNNILVRSMNILQQHVNDAKQKHSASVQRETILKEQLARETTESNNRIQIQEQIIADALIKDEHTQDRIVGLEAYAEELKNQFLAVSEERDSLLHTLAEKDDMVSRLSEEKDSLEKELQEQAEETAADLEKTRDALAREEALKKELTKQKAIFDGRLQEIRSILGVSAISEIKAELDTVARLCAEKQHFRKCPSIKAPSLRVPLLIRLHHKAS